MILLRLANLTNFGCDIILNKTSKIKGRILIAPLNWGLGHSTRMVPIIRYFIRHSYEVTLASDGLALIFLQQEFPELKCISLPGNNIQYGKNSRSTSWKLTLQTPAFIRNIKKENKVLEELQHKYSFDLIVSDNRYGMWHPDIPSVLITHQLHLPMPFLRATFNHYLRQWINCFDECWVPDFHSSDTALAGKLSRPAPLDCPLYYMGLLSRFIKKENSGNSKILLMLSGPEPQRSLLEQLLLDALPDSREIILVRGSDLVVKEYPKNVELISLARTEKMAELLDQCSTVICRSGYSSLMDLLPLEKEMIFIPTPGQYEQEYLGEQLAKKGYQVLSQKALSSNKLNTLLKKDIPTPSFPHKSDLDDFLQKAMDRLNRRSTTNIISERGSV